MLDETNKGKRVKLIHTNDQYTNLKPGDLGTYEYSIINKFDRATLFIQHSIEWDNGSRLMLIGGEDSFSFVED